MEDGYQARYVFASKPTVSLWEVTVKPPGLDGGEPINTTTMQNTKWRTQAHRHLQTLAGSSCNFAYDPDVYNDLLSLVNTTTSVTVWWSDGSALAFFGFLQKLEFGELKEGEMPTAVGTIVPTNADPTTHVESGPVFQPAAGT
jgi:hypothetical protein